MLEAYIFKLLFYVFSVAYLPQREIFYVMSFLCYACF